MEWRFNFGVIEMDIQIRSLEDLPHSDEALEALLVESYVGGGFTDPELAPMLRARAVRSRGAVLVAVDASDTVVGTLTLVASDSAASELAKDREVEFHLLCVKPDMRGRGVGRALVAAGLAEASKVSAEAVVLWTQPTMHAAQQLYVRSGFHRDPSAAFKRHNRSFLVYRRSLLRQEESSNVEAKNSAGTT